MLILNAVNICNNAISVLIATSILRDKGVNSDGIYGIHWA
jgi:hypothetical protein